MVVALSGRERCGSEARASRTAVAFQALELRAQIRGVLVAQVAVLLERAMDDFL